MHGKLLSLAALASVATAQNLTAVIASNPNLRNLTQYLGFFPQIVTQLQNMTNITLLAPSNEAFEKLLSGPAASQVQANDTSLIDALFSYHILDGKYMSSNFTSAPQFVPTKLVAANYTNLASGQRVEGLKSGNSTTFYSGLLSNTTITQAVRRNHTHLAPSR